MEADVHDGPLDGDAFGHAPAAASHPHAAEIARLEAEVSRLRSRVVAAATHEEAEAYRRELDGVEEHLIRLERLVDNGGCEGWPAGK